MGREYPDVHRLMDSSAKLGPCHQRPPPHDSLTGFILYRNDLERLKSFLLHEVIDWSYSQFERQMKKSAKRRFRSVVHR